MDEQRFQEYLNLIAELLACENERESEILEAKSHLIDRGLVQAMEWVANQMAEAGEPNAEWLQNFATYLAKTITETEAKWEQLNQQAVQLYQQGKFSEAVILAEQALNLVLSLYAGDHPDVATSLNNLAGLYKSQGLYERAKPLYEQALQMFQRLSNGDNADVATSLNNLAGLYKSQGLYERAKPLYEQALQMRQRLFKDDHHDVATSLNNLALFYKYQGLYVQAKTFYEQALQMFQRLFNGDHSDVATSLNNLAELYKSQGLYDRAEPLLEKALQMRQHLFNRDHPDVAASLNNLAGLYKSQGLYDQAKIFYEQALQMKQRLFNGDHPQVATSLNNLAELYKFQGLYDRAESLLEKALQMRQRLFNGDHPDVAASLNNLAVLYQSQGLYVQAKPLLEKALQMFQRLFNGDHLDVAASLNNLALLYKSQGLYDQAKPLLEKALQMMQGLFNGDHPDVATCFNSLSGLFAATNRPAEALEKMREASEVEDRIIRRVFAASSERDRLHYMQTIRDNLEALLSLVCNYLPDSPQAVQTAFNAVLKRKSLTASAQAALHSALYSDRYPHLKPEFDLLQTLNTEIVHLTFSPPLPIPQETQENFRTRQTSHQKRLSELKTASAKIEKQLASQVPEIQLQQLQAVDEVRRAVALELPSGSVLVEFVRFQAFDFIASQDKRWLSARYVAFVMPSGQAGAVQMIQLGDAKNIDRLIQVFRSAAQDYLSNNTTNLGLTDESKPVSQVKNEVTADKPSQKTRLNCYAKAGIELRAAIYEPLRDAVCQYQHLLIAADGNLNLVPFQILPTDETGKRRLMDDFTISYLSVGRDILRNQIQTNRIASQPLILADPKFDWDEESVADVDIPLKTGEDITDMVAVIDEELSLESLKTPTAQQAINTLSGSYFTPAPGTRFLGESVAKKFNVEPYLQEEALESRLTDGKCPRVLLIATHGFFSKIENRRLKLIGALLNRSIEEKLEILLHHRSLLDDELIKLMKMVAKLWVKDGFQDEANWLEKLAEKLPEIMAQLPLEPTTQNPGGDRFSSTTVENPMMLSGLALAGANTWRSGGKLPAKAGKGFLFAQDVALLDLWANEITVLSACDTAMGDIKIGEGVFGLRRAFPLAGSKTLVMSLWPVPDKATALLMDRFFDNLNGGKGRADALQEAQNYLSTITVRELHQSSLGRDVLDELVNTRHLSLETIEDTQDLQPLEHPFYWGAWVCQGDTRNFSF